MISDISSYIDRHRPELFKLMEELVLIQSYSRNKAGVDRVGRHISRVMTDMGFSCEFCEQAELGNHLIARSPAAARTPKGQILITGHMDTVFPEDSPFNWYREDETKCYGPGVADMKGGLVVGIFALRALVATGLLKTLPVTFVFNSDEEIGSPTSRGLIADEARHSRLAYVLEAGGMNNEIVTGRKGNLSAELTLTGKAGHAAFAGADKASAILEFAHKAIAIEAMNRPEKGISANVGTISGGIGPNTVPDHATARLDFRFLTPEDADSVRQRLDEIVATCTIPGTAATMAVRSGRPPMPQTQGNQELFDKIQNLAQELGTPVQPELRQGVSDANIIAEQGIPVIDGLGPAGEKDHSEDEYIQKASLWERAILFGNILAEI
ncbi:MAG: M20 family metallopeptidase [Desulfobacter sp.]|nr:MAG: M20 family metallopeptidase [Desulfobacter sp.]